MARIAFLTVRSPHHHGRWAGCASTLLAVFQHQLAGVLELELEEYWEYFHRVVEENCVFEVDMAARTGNLRSSATLCKLVRSPPVPEDTVLPCLLARSVPWCCAGEDLLSGLRGQNGVGAPVARVS